jgi:nickel/cobalt transporter (NicO) family protein
MRAASLALLASALVSAHPMGNFSVNHYTRLEPKPSGVDIVYALDLAEIPTYSMLREWNLDAKSPQADLDRRASGQAARWAAGLEFKVNGTLIAPKLNSTSIKLSEGAGNLSVTRIEMKFSLPPKAGTLEFEDHNFDDRAGWKEIVVRANPSAPLIKTSQGDQELSKALTEYPADPTSAPPQDLRASIEWKVSAPVVSVAPKVVPIQQPKAVPPPAASSLPNAPPAPGAVVKGDYLSQLLGKKEIGLGLMLAGIAVAFVLGAGHALTPGHGKTIVAAYLVGSRGTPKHAAFLGAMVTFTHTISVFLLGLATLFLTSYVNQEKITQVLGTVSGLSIVLIGGTLFFKRYAKLRAIQAHEHAHAHGHAHSHDHHHHDHDHDHDHHHGPGGHSHVPEGDITMGSLMALGASGGLVPCPSALVLLLSSVALGHVGLGLILLVSFSLGLAGVLMAIGMAVLFAKSWLPDPKSTSRHPFFRMVPVFSAAVVVCLGLLMTGVSLGWLHSGVFAG